MIILSLTIIGIIIIIMKTAIIIIETSNVEVGLSLRASGSSMTGTLRSRGCVSPS